MKENRTILFSTHFLEEADVLGDKIIILSNGKIIANDSSFELKLKYGNGYKLILNKNNQMNLFEIIEKYLIYSKIEIETNNHLIIQTNEQYSHLFIQLFNHLDYLKENNFILNYSLSNPSLDDVYLNLLKEEEDNIDYEIFNNKLISNNFDYYLSQYEGLFIKSFKIAKRNIYFLLFILLIPFLIIYYLNQNSKYSNIEYSFDDWSHLNNHYVYIAFDQFYYPNIKRSPNTNIIYLYNITNIKELNHLLWSMFTPESENEPNRTRTG